MCWVPSKVSNEPCSWFARSTPALYGVAGSRVVETTRVGARPGAEMVCRLNWSAAPARMRRCRNGGVAGEFPVAHERCDLTRAAVFVDDLGAILDRQVIDAVDRHPGVGGVGVMTVLVPAHVQVGQIQQRVALMAGPARLIPQSSAARRSASTAP